jgi:hypothetical protein
MVTRPKSNIGGKLAFMSLIIAAHDYDHLGKPVDMHLSKFIICPDTGHTCGIT